MSKGSAQGVARVHARRGKVTVRMRSAFKGWMLAAGITLAGLSPAVAQTAAPGGNTASAPAETTIGNSAAAAEQAPDVAPAAPTIAADGAPTVAGNPLIGRPTDRLMSIQPQVTENGQRAMDFHNHILLPLIVVICLLVLALLVSH